MPSIVDYDVVLTTMRQAGFACHYPNGGAFGLADPQAARSIGWIGPPDDTIRAEVRPWVRQIPAPFPANLARFTSSAWKHLGGSVWLMPMSHWAYELSHGNKDWLPDALTAAGIDPHALEQRGNAAAIEFTPGEELAFACLIERLFEHLAGSDFALAFPGKPTIAALHHHQQVWWTSSDAGVMAVVNGLAVLTPTPASCNTP